MRGLLTIFNIRTALLVLAALVAVLALDGGSVVLTKMSSADDIKHAGHEAASVAKTGPATQRTAVAALAVARQDAEAHGIDVEDKGFTIYPDGRVTLTGTKTAPTLLMEHLRPFSHLIHVSTTLTVEPLPFD
jgi:hypothetical protein